MGRGKGRGTGRGMGMMVPFRNEKIAGTIKPSDFPGRARGLSAKLGRGIGLGFGAISAAFGLYVQGRTLAEPPLSGAYQVVQALLAPLLSASFFELIH